MTLYPYVAALAVDPVSLVAAKGATGQIFAPADTSFASPLTASDATGNPIPLTANADGILPSFYATLPAVNWRSGSFTFPLVTSQPIPGADGTPGVPGLPGTPGKDGANVLPTAVAVAAEVNSRIGGLDEVFRGLNLMTYGHSFLGEGYGLPDVTKHYARMLADHYGMYYPTAANGTTNLKRAVGGSLAEESAQIMNGTGAATWSAGTRAVLLLQLFMNTARKNGIDAATIAGATHSTRAICAIASSSQFISETNAMFTYTDVPGAVWSSGTGTIFSGGTFKYPFTQTGAVGASVTFTTPAANVWFLTAARKAGLAGCVIEFRNATTNALITTFDNTNQAAANLPGSQNYVPAPIRLNVPAGTGVKVTHVSGAGTFTVDGLLVPDSAPVPIIIVKEPHLVDYSKSTMFPNGSDAVLDRFNQIHDQIATEFPNVVLADPNTAGYWSKSTSLLMTDGVHPNYSGNAALFETVRDAIRETTLQRLARSAFAV